MASVNAVYPVDIIVPNDWRKPVRYRLHETMTIAGVEVPKGTLTDGATISRWLWPIFPPVCRYFLAVVVHDHLLQTGTSWKVANRHFKQALKEYHIRPWRRIAMGAGVSIYGWFKEISQ